MKPETAQALADAMGGKLQPDGKFINIIKHTGKTGEYVVTSIPVNIAGLSQLAVEHEINAEWGVDYFEARDSSRHVTAKAVAHDGTQESKEAAYCEAVAQCLIQMLGERQLNPV